MSQHITFINCSADGIRTEVSMRDADPGDCIYMFLEFMYALSSSEASFHEFLQRMATHATTRLARHKLEPGHVG